MIRWFFRQPIVIAACERDIRELPRIFMLWLTARLPARTDLCATDTAQTPRLTLHHCPVEGWMEIEAGQPCNWCGRTEPAPAVFRPRNRRSA